MTSSIETYGSGYLNSIFSFQKGDIKIKHPGIAIKILLNKLKCFGNFSAGKI